MKGLVLSVFTGAGLLDRGFELEGFCVVSAGDILWGRDVRDFKPARHAFEGIIGGPPCQSFSRANRSGKSREDGDAAVEQFARCVTEAEPDWFLCENVPQVPDIVVEGYQVQRLNLNAKECGCSQNRLRCFQFGSRDGVGLVIPRGPLAVEVSPCCMATEGKRKHRRSFADFCELQGLPRDFYLPGLSLAMKYRLVGNGVPIPMARVIARSVLARQDTRWTRVCVCHCGRPVTSGRTLATPACRKRMQRRRDTAGVTELETVTPPASLPGLLPSLS